MRRAALLAALALAALPCAAQTSPVESGVSSTIRPPGTPARDAAPAEASIATPPRTGTPPDPTVGPLGSTDARQPEAVAPGAQPTVLNADVAAAVEGAWVLVDGENLPSADVLVFTRLTFRDGEMTTTTVLLDPDDGDLRGRRRRDRYLVSDGQLIVRDGFNTSVLDVQRDGDRLTVRDVAVRSVLRLRREDPRLAVDPTLVGAWTAAPPATREPLTIAFGADGRAVGTSNGDPFDVDYEGAGAYVLVDNRDTFRYTVLGDRLVLERGDELIELDRVRR